jgi:hypothetical protein
MFFKTAALQVAHQRAMSQSVLGHPRRPPGGIKKFSSTLPRPREQSRFAKLVEKPCVNAHK